MRAFLDELKHAFALSPSTTASPPLPKSLDRLAESVVSRGLEIPALLFLETSRPFSFLAGQTLFAASPFLKMIGDFEDVDTLATALEDRRMVMRLIRRIEALAEEQGDIR